MKVVITSGFIPEKKHVGDAGFDLKTPENFQIKPGEVKRISLGVAIEIDESEVALVQGRSGLASKNGITTIGNIIDSNYRGEISAILVNHGQDEINFQRGDRIAQLLVLKLGNQNIVDAASLSTSSRGTAGYGSTGV